MRLHLIKNSYSDSLDRYMPGIVMKGKLEATFKVRDPMGLVVKEDVDKALTQFPPEWITKPFLPTAFPAFKGDFVKNDKGGYDLKFIHKNETTFKIPEVDYAGRVTKEADRGLNADDFDGFPFERIRDNSFPRKPEELGILNNIPLDGSGSTNAFVHTNRKEELDLKKNKLDLVTSKQLKDFEAGKNEYLVGDIILADSKADLSKEGFLRLNGGLASKDSNKELYEIIGDYYGMDFGKYGAGAPWKILDTMFPSTPTIKIGGGNIKKNTFHNDHARVPNGKGRGGYAMAITHNKVHIIGGFLNNRNKPHLSVLSSELDSNGKVVKWEETLFLEKAIIGGVALVANNRLYVVGGMDRVSNTEGGVKASVFDIEPDGSLSNERTTGTALPEQMLYCGAHIQGRVIYCYGGHRRGSDGIPHANHNCYRAVILPNGDLSPWVLEDTNLEIATDACVVDAYRTRMGLGYAISKRNPPSGSYDGRPMNGNSTIFISRGFDEETKTYISPDTKLNTPITNKSSLNYEARTISTRDSVMLIYDYYNGGTKTRATVMSVDQYGLPNKVVQGITPSPGKEATGIDRGRGHFEVVVSKDNLIVGPGLGTFIDNDTYPSERFGNNVLRLELPGLGSNSYKEYYDGTKYLDGVPKDKFVLPDIPDQSLDGELYSFFIKAK